MTTSIKCHNCNTSIDITQDIADMIGNDIQLICDDLAHTLKIMHRNCDPIDMTKEDSLVWEKWNRVFNPQNYLPEEL